MDTDLETQFLDERVEAGRMRARVMSAVAMLVTAAIGLNDARMSARLAPEFFQLALPLRFLVVVPSWFLIFVLTFLPFNRRRTEWVNAVATVVACWALALSGWHHSWFFPNNGWQINVQIDLLAVLLISAFGLPFRFSQIAAVAVGGLGGAALFFELTIPSSQVYSLGIMKTGLLGIGACTLVMSWWRESGDRAMFGQREHARKLAEKLAASNKELQRLTAEQAEFIAIAAHDLRAPLAVVRGLAELIDTNVLKDEQRRPAVQEIGRQVTRMLGLVTDYLGAHAAEGRAADARIESLDLVVAARTAVSRHTASAQTKGQNVAYEGAAQTSLALADPGMLDQVLDNLVLNAIKFSPRDGAIRVAVLPIAAGGWRVAVSDSGPGLSKEDQANLFRKFGRASTRPTGGETSHGLGLAVVRRLAEAMRGRVGCESEPGRGATFWIELPSAQAA